MKSITKILSVFLTLSSAGYCAEMTQEKWEGFSSYFEKDRAFRTQYREAYNEWFTHDLHESREIILDSGVEVRASNLILERLSQTYQMKMPETWEGVSLGMNYKEFKLGETYEDIIHLRQVHRKICNLQFSASDWTALNFGLMYPGRRVFLQKGDYEMSDVRLFQEFSPLLENIISREEGSLIIRLKSPTSQYDFIAFMASHKREVPLASFGIVPINRYGGSENGKTLKPYLYN